MSSRPIRTRDPARHTEPPGFFARLVTRVGKTLRWLLLSLLFSIGVECLGIVFWWPEQGLEHSRQMLIQELAYLDNEFQRSLLNSNPGRLARTIVESSHNLLFEKTGIVKLSDWLSRPPSRNETKFRSTLHQFYAPITVFINAAIQTVSVFSVRITILSLAMPLFLLISFVGLVDGLVQRDLRRWGGGRESSYLYHNAKKSIWILLLLSWVSYLALPISLRPVLIVLPFAVMFGVSISVTASTFKKYL